MIYEDVSRSLQSLRPSLDHENSGLFSVYLVIALQLAPETVESDLLGVEPRMLHILDVSRISHASRVLRVVGAKYPEKA